MLSNQDSSRFNRCSSSPHASAFTLVELMIAILVVVILSFISFSIVPSVMDRARAVKSAANIHNLAVANQNYASDHKTFCPADDQYNTRRWHGSRVAISAPFNPTKGLLSDYLGLSRRVTTCPLFAHLVTASSSFEEGTGGYGYNSQYIGGKPGGFFNSVTKLREAERPANVQDPANTVMFATSAYARADGLQEYAYAEPPFWDFGNGNLSFRPSASVHFRANGKAIVAWCDGHVSYEVPNGSKSGMNPHGGDAEEFSLGWFGREENNGAWNSRKTSD